MQTKDYILISISCCALTLSLISLILALVQKNRETRRTIRKTMTDTLESISKINIEATKLKASKETDFNSEAIVLLRRNYNTQRRILVAHADFLILRYDKLSTEIDCNILASAYATIGDQDKAEYFWQQTINKSISDPIRLMNLRGFGTFLFVSGKADLGKQCFKDALQINLPKNDDNLALLADTYIMLTDLEAENGNKDEAHMSLMSARSTVELILNEKRKYELQERIRSKLP